MEEIMIDQEKLKQTLRAITFPTFASINEDGNTQIQNIDLNESIALVVGGFVILEFNPFVSENMYAVLLSDYGKRFINENHFGYEEYKVVDGRLFDEFGIPINRPYRESALVAIHRWSQERLNKE